MTAPNLAVLSQCSRAEQESLVKIIMDRTLGHIDPAELETAVNDQGVTPFDFIMNEVRAKEVRHATGLSREFWEMFWAEYNLQRDIGAEVHDCDFTIDDALIDAIDQMFAININNRGPEKLLRWLDSAPACSERELYGITNAMQSDMLSRATANKVQGAVCVYIMRHRHDFTCCWPEMCCACLF